MCLHCTGTVRLEPLWGHLNVPALYGYRSVGTSVGTLTVLIEMFRGLSQYQLINAAILLEVGHRHSQTDHFHYIN